MGAEQAAGWGLSILQQETGQRILLFTEQEGNGLHGKRGLRRHGGGGGIPLYFAASEEDPGLVAAARGMLPG